MNPVDAEKSILLREFVHERLGFIRARAEIAQRFCELGDDAGLAYMFHQLKAEFKLAIKAQGEIESIRLKPEAVS